MYLVWWRLFVILYIYISLFSSVVTVLYLCKWGWKNYTQRAVTFVIFLIGIKYVSNIFYMFLSFARNVASESPLRICENVIWLLSHNFSMMMFWNETFSTLLGFLGRESAHKEQVTWNFRVFFDVRLKKMNKEWIWAAMTLMRRHCTCS